MDDLFAKEKNIIMEAEKSLISKAFASAADAELYEELLNEYRKMLKQMRSMVKMSDMMEWKLNSLSRELERLSNIDELTNLYNRRFFNETYQKEWYSAARSRLPLGMLMLDIDYFKKYNDMYGHLQGDKCLQAIAGTIQKTVKRPSDFVARFGGEEFVVLLPETNLNGCACVAGKILADIRSLNLSNASENSSGSVSVSIGIGSIIPDKDMELEALLRTADEALYQAKREGRDCYR